MIPARATGLPPFRRTVLAACLVAPVLLPAPVRAQADTPVLAEDVVVSASRREQSGFDAPAAVQSVNAETIRDAGPQVNLSESLSRVPGVIVLNRQNYAQDLQLSIRGFGARSTFGIRGVRLLVDGIPATMPDGQGQASTISLPSTDRIEVLRGPLAQLYGNAAGGVVQAFTREAPAVPEASAQIFFGSFGTRRLGLQAAGRFGSTGLVVDYSDFQTDGWRQHSAAERQHLNSRLTFGEGPLRVALVANFFRQPLSLDPLGLTRAEFDDNPRQAGGIVRNGAGVITDRLALSQNSRKTVEQDQIGATAELKLGASDRLSGRLYAGRRELDNALSIPIGAQQANTSAGGIVDLSRRYQGVGLAYAFDRRLGGMPLTTTVGIDHDRMKDRRQGFLNLQGERGALRRDEDNLVTSTDVYLQSSLAVSERFTVIAGARSSRVRFDVDDFFVRPGTPVNGDDSGNRSYSATNPVLGVTWHAAPTLNVYANLGRGFETPTFTELAYRRTGSGLNLGLDAARSRHLETGLKWRPAPQQFLDLALFSIRTSDEIAVESNTGGRSTFQNVGSTKRQGLELSWRGRIADTLTGQLALNLLDATFEDSFVTSPAAGQTVAIAAGNRLPGVPRRFAFGEVVWRPAVLGAQNAARRAHLGVEVLHSGNFFANDANSADALAASYTVVNLRAVAEQRFADWRFAQFFRVDNATDRRYAGSVIVNEGNRRFFESAPGRGYTVGASVTRLFR